MTAHYNILLYTAVVVCTVVDYHHVLGVWPCISGCEYDGSTICSALPPAPGCWLVHGLPSRTSTGTATRLGEDRALAAAAAWCSTCMPFSCCARFVLYLWFWNQIFTWNNTRESQSGCRVTSCTCALYAYIILLYIIPCVQGYRYIYNSVRYLYLLLSTRYACFWTLPVRHMRPNFWFT